MMTSPHRAALVVAWAMATTCLASAARADDDLATRARIAFVQQRLDRATPAANLWWNGWMAGYGALTVGQATAATITTNADLRKDFAVGAFASSLGVVGLGVVPFPARDAAAMLRASPDASPAERRAKLARAERLLESSAKAERLGRSWLAHVAAASVAAATGLVLALGYHRVGSGIGQIGAGIVIGELQIFTQPRAAIEDWDAYRAQRFTR